MSFNSEYMALRKKRKQGGVNADLTDYQEKAPTMLYSSTDIKPKYELDDDVAPVKTSSSPAPSALEGIAPVKEDNRTWFQKGAFEDGYQFGDVMKTINATGSDLRASVTAGLLGIGEKVVDAGAWVGGKVGGWFNDEVEEKAAKFIAKDLYDEKEIAKKIVNYTTPNTLINAIADKAMEDGEYNGLTKWLANNYGNYDIDEDSVLGEKADDLAYSGGQLIGQVALKAVGVPWVLTTGLTSFGGEAESALQQGASYNEAGFSAAVSTAAEILTEKMFGGSGLGEKGVFDKFTSKITSNISNKAVKVVLDYVGDIGGEALEEFVSEVASTLGSQLSYESETKIDEVFNNEASFGEYVGGAVQDTLSKEKWADYRDAAIGGAVLGGVANVGKVGRSIAKGTDYNTGLTENDTKVFDHEYQKRIAEKEQKGELSKKAKEKIANEVMEDLQNGAITTDTIEEVLGGENYTAYKDASAKAKSLVDAKNDLVKRYADMIKSGNTENAASEHDLAKQIYDMQGQIAEATEVEKAARKNLSDYMNKSLSRMRGKRIVEDGIARGYRDAQTQFKIDTNAKYSEKQREMLDKIADKKVINNTRGSHKFWEMATGVAADRGYDLEVVTTEDIVAEAMERFTKKLGSAEAAKAKVEALFKFENGKPTVIPNGYRKGNKIVINAESRAARSFTFGHEIMHTLMDANDATKLKKFKERMFAYAKAKEGEAFEERKKAIEERYEGDENANPEDELLCDLVGEYIYGDSDFIYNELTKDKNIFLKVWDEVKYLCKMATTGSKEKRDLLRIEREFERAYRKKIKPSEGGEKKFSLGDTVKPIDKYSQKEYNDFGWASYAEAITTNELDDMYSKIHEKGSLKKFPQSRVGESVVEVNDNPKSLGVNNVMAFVTGTKNNPQINRVARFQAETEAEMDYIKEKLYEGNTFSDTYFRFLKQIGIAREYKRESSLNYRGYQEQVGRGSGGDSRGQADTNGGSERNGSGTVAETQANEIAPIKEASSNDGVFFDGEKTNYSLSANDDTYSRIYDMKIEVGKLNESIKEFERTEDFKSATSRLSDAIANDDIENGIKAYQQWLAESGYEALKNQRDALQEQIDIAQKEFADSVAANAAEKEQADVARSGLSEAEYFFKKAVKEFGYTPHFYDAGYITPNGKMLNFSGEKGRHFGTRGQDHRAIGLIYETSQGSEALFRFVKDGNIRIMAESPGIDVSSVAEPTSEQYATIRKFISEYSDKGYFGIDITDENGRVVDSLEYEGRINPARIVNDIKHYFSTGEVRQQSDIDRFRYSLSDSTASGAKPADTFYSHMGRVVDGIKQAKIGADSVVNMLRGKGVKAEEIKWSGIEDFLDGKKSVTKEELQEFVAGSMLQIEEQQLGGAAQFNEEQQAKVREISAENSKLYDECKALWTYLTGEDFPHELYNASTCSRVMQRKVAESDIPLESAPRLIEIADKITENSNKLGYIVEDARLDVPPTKWESYKLDGGDNYREIVFKLPNSDYTNSAMRTHWGKIKGVLAHARIQDMETADGKSMLFIEEIQSDWHNEGYKRGYEEKLNAKQKARVADINEQIDVLVAEQDSLMQELTGEFTHDFEVYGKCGSITEQITALEDELFAIYGKERKGKFEAPIPDGVPDAPFRDNYQEFVLKRLIRMAAEEGYDSIGWTTADIQAERWSEDYAEGYRIEYDQDIPSFLKKYGKKWGASVGKDLIARDGYTVNGESYDAENVEVWSMPITDSMRQSVIEEGQPLYSLSDSDGNALTKEQGDYFKDSKVRDEKGNLKRVYHGSGAEFTEFSYKHMGVHGSAEGRGFYFTDKKSLAEGYQKNGAKLMEGYLDIKNPLSDSKKTLKRGEVVKLLKAVDPTGDDVVINYDPMGGVGYPSKAWYDRALQATVDAIMRYSDSDSEILADIANSGAGNEVVLKTARQLLGYDGFIVTGNYENATIYVAFESNQFKSVDNLNPTENPNIQLSLSDATDGELLPDVYKEGLEAYNRQFVDDSVAPVVDKAVAPAVDDSVDEVVAPTPTIADGIKSLYAEYGWDEANTDIDGIADGILTQWDMDGAMEGNALHNLLAEKAVYENGVLANEDELHSIIKAELQKAVPALKESTFPKWADNEVAAYKHYIAEDRANAKPRKKPLFSALKRLVVTKPKGKVEHHGVLTSDGKQYMTCNGVFVAEMNAPDKSIMENEKLAVDALKGILANANANAIEGNYTIDPIDISLIRKQVNNSDKNVVIVGDNVYDIRYVDAILQAIENPTISLTPFRGLHGLLVKGSNGQAVIMPIDHRTGADKFKYVYKAESNVLAENVAPTPASEEDAHAAQNIESLTDADAPAEVEAPMPETEPKTAENPFEERDYKGVGDRKVKAFMAENPEVKSFFQEEARVMLGELQNTTKGERWYDDEVYYASGGEKGWSGTERLTTDDIAYLLDNGRGNGKGYTYAEIEKGLMDIIEDNGRENHACAKRIEFLINDRLMKGHKDIDGVEIPPNQEYIDLLNDLEKKQNAEAQPFEAKDADAPTEDIAPVWKDRGAEMLKAKAEEIIKTTNEAPIAKEYEAIKPKVERKQAGEPRMKRVDSEEAKRGGEKERSWYETSTSSEAVDGLVTPDDIPDDVRYYHVKSNKKTLAMANARLERDGYAKSREYFEGRMSDKKLTVEDIALGERLIQEAAKAGDVKAVRDLIIDVSILGTELGQRVQALSMIRRLTPEGQLRALQRTIERGKAKGDKAFDGVEITDDMIKRILDVIKKDGTFNPADLHKAVEDVKQKIADQMKVTKLDYINAWRYLSMLGNPKTHIRNIVSNVAMAATRSVKNAVARTIETIAPIKNRTKTWMRSTEAVKAFAMQTTADMEADIKGDTKYSDEGSLKDKRKIFKTKAGNFMANANSAALEFEDAIFSKRVFRKTLQEYLTANGIKTEADIKKNPEIVAKAKDYALEESRRATFRQDSYIANKIGEIERKNPALGVVVGSVMPFKKTPINIAKTGLAYSPLGIARNIYDAVQVGKGNMDAAEAIDHLAQTLTGTSLALLGYALASAGLLNGAGDDDKEGKYDYQLGKQAYSFNFGGNTYSLSWLSPVAMPLFVGVNAYEQLVEKEDLDANVVVDALAQTLDPLSEMSFISSLDEVLSSYDSGVEKFMGMGQSMVQNYITQFVPTLSSQVAATFDDTKRSTKASGNSEFEFGEETLNKIKYKIPGLRNTLEPTTDIWGNEYEQTEGIPARSFESFLSPANKREGIATRVDDELKSLYQKVGNSEILPYIPYDYINYKDVKYDMSAKEHTAYKQTYGQEAYDLLNRLFRTSTYRAATAEEKAKMVSSVYDYARDIAKQEYLKGHGITYTNSKEDGADVYKENPIKGAIEADMTVEEYTFSQKYPDKYSIAKSVGGFDIYQAFMDDLYDIKADKDEDGKSIVGSRKEKVLDYINGLDADYGAKLIIFKSQYKADDTYNWEIIDYLNSRADISYSQMETILKALGFKVSASGNVSW